MKAIDSWGSNLLTWNTWLSGGIKELGDKRKQFQNKSQKKWSRTKYSDTQSYKNNSLKVVKKFLTSLFKGRIWVSSEASVFGLTLGSKVSSPWLEAGLVSSSDMQHDKPPNTSEWLPWLHTLPHILVYMGSQIANVAHIGQRQVRLEPCDCTSDPVWH